MSLRGVGVVWVWAWAAAGRGLCDKRAGNEGMQRQGHSCPSAAAQRPRLPTRLPACPPRAPQVIDVVVQNLPAGSNGGEYRFNTSRNGMEQHPFHLHGHHFWLLGTGERAADAAWRRQQRRRAADQGSLGLAVLLLLSCC